VTEIAPLIRRQRGGMVWLTPGASVSEAEILWAIARWNRGEPWAMGLFGEPGRADCKLPPEYLALVEVDAQGRPFAAQAA
jgi:hypothetical protein